MSDRNIILTSFKYFSNFLQPFSTNTKNAKDTDIRDNYIRSASIYIRSTCTKDIYIVDTYIKDT